MDVFVTILISLAVIAVTGTLFVGWIGVVVVRGAFRLFTPKKVLPLAQSLRARLTRSPGMVRCGRENCLNFNPPAARFCRCCGAQLAAKSVRRPVRELQRIRMPA